MWLQAKECRDFYELPETTKGKERFFSKSFRGNMTLEML